ncbi:MAG: 30S ribosomal protein S20 [Alphaproteobacteria bacterium]|nr:30S ribosomal protein S20 [Alphaproteobacteria bacterium SS10]
MANHKSAKKRIRQTERRTAVRRIRISTIRTYVKQVEQAISGGDQSAAQEALKVAQPHMQSGVTHGVLHKNTVARKISRLAQRIKKMA